MTIKDRLRLGKVRDKLSLIKRKIQDYRKPTIEVPEDWIKEETNPVKTRVVKVKVPTVKKYRVPHLLPVKRVLAGLMFIVNLVTGVSAFGQRDTGLLSLIFLPTSFILLDYLWKTRVK